jgi:hypothetical protein
MFTSLPYAHGSGEEFFSSLEYQIRWGLTNPKPIEVRIKTRTNMRRADGKQSCGDA